VKFAASSFIPVIGGAVSEAYSTIHSSMGVIRTGIGSIGIIIICIMILKPVVTIIAIKFIVSIAQIISGIFEQKECSEFLKSTNAVMSIGLSVVICFSVIFVIATAVLMMTAMNIGA
ncbi:MAG: sporulation protein, partial [Ruminococcus sp.]|nr:sporulation protein [Ruminococcus sp.]